MLVMSTGTMVVPAFFAAVAAASAAVSSLEAPSVMSKMVLGIPVEFANVL